MCTDSRISDEAAEWVAKIDRGLTQAEDAQLERWRAEDPRHAGELARIQSAWTWMDQSRASAEVVAMAREASRARRAARIRRRWAGASAVAVAAAAAAFVFALRRPAPVATAAPEAAYRVIPPDSERIILSDGSVVDLRHGGGLHTDFSAAYRRVVLDRGEAHFSVTHNPARPFVVSLGAVAVRAVGTAFDIRRGQSEIEVLVTEGKVTVEDSRRHGNALPVPLLLAGQRARIELDGSGALASVAIDQPAQPEVERDLAWRSTWLVFDRTPLDQAVAAFNDHGSVRMVFGQDALRHLRLGGRFRADNIDGFVWQLQNSLDVMTKRRADGAIVLLSAR